MVLYNTLIFLIKFSRIIWSKS